jgi:hypothetical protein
MDMCGDGDGNLSEEGSAAISFVLIGPLSRDSDSPAPSLLTNGPSRGSLGRPRLRGELIVD